MTTGEIENAPASPGHAPSNVYNAMIQLAKGRRGRTLIVSAVIMVVMAGLFFQTSTESLSYKSLSEYRLPSWQPKGPSEIPEPKEIFTPSNTTLEIENGKLENVPSHLKKETPDFHLLLPAMADTADFCKVAISTMIMDYPAPTIINFRQAFQNETDRQRGTMKNILQYLSNKKDVQDDDVVMIVDGYDVHFQLPASVLVKQYENILAEANQRLKDKYGVVSSKGESSRPRYDQTIVWGADKKCWPEKSSKLACPTVPESPMPTNLYGLETDDTETLSRAKYLNAGTVIGPAKDLRAIFASALPRMGVVNGTEPTAQYVLSTLFSEQELAREAALKSASGGWGGWLPSKSPQKAENNSTAIPPRVEFSMGLDYTHSLFQPTTSTASKELVARPHSELQTMHHVNTPTLPLTLPSALLELPPPYHTLDPSKDHSPNPMSAYVKNLIHDKNLDSLPSAKKGWSEMPLWTNTYTGAVPAILHVNRPPPPPPTPKDPDEAASADVGFPPRINPNPRAEPADDAKKEKPVFAIAWKDLWFHPHTRALARAALRTPQGSLAWHAAAVGGDSWWDMRGGKGGVWTTGYQWLGFGEEDGVCHGRQMAEEVFADGKGQWLREDEERQAQLEEIERQKLAASMQKQALEEEERKKEQEAKDKVEEENRKQLKAEEKKIEEELGKKQKEEAKKKAEEAEKKKLEEVERKKQEAAAKKKEDADRKQEEAWEEERKGAEGKEP